MTLMCAKAAIRLQSAARATMMVCIRSSAVFARSAAAAVCALVTAPVAGCTRRDEHGEKTAVVVVAMPGLRGGVYSTRGEISGLTIHPELCDDQ